MSVSELNQFMTYVLEGWMLFSASFVSIGFISFAARRIQEDLEAEALALAQTESAPEGVIEGVTESVAEVKSGVNTAVNPTVSADLAPPARSESAIEAAEESARLEEVAAVSEQLAKTRGKQSDTSSVSVSS